MAEETTPSPGNYHLLTLVFPPLATKSVSLSACMWLPESALMLMALDRSAALY